jgi:hypothetical protein
VVVEERGAAPVERKSTGSIPTTVVVALLAVIA